jgi:hypothetical protein
VFETPTQRESPYENKPQRKHTIFTVDAGNSACHAAEDIPRTSANIRIERYEFLLEKRQT